jgi:hypothetical protein
VFRERTAGCSARRVGHARALVLLVLTDALVRRGRGALPGFGHQATLHYRVRVPFLLVCLVLRALDCARGFKARQGWQHEQEGVRNALFGGPESMYTAAPMAATPPMARACNVERGQRAQELGGDVRTTRGLPLMFG